MTLVYSSLLTNENLGSELPHLVDDEFDAIRVALLGQHDEVRVGAVVEAALDALQAQHRGRRRRDGLQGLGYAGAGPVEEVRDTLDERYRAIIQVSERRYLFKSVKVGGVFLPPSNPVGAF